MKSKTSNNHVIFGAKLFFFLFSILEKTQPGELMQSLPAVLAFLLTQKVTWFSVLGSKKKPVMLVCIGFCFVFFSCTKVTEKQNHTAGSVTRGFGMRRFEATHWCLSRSQVHRRHIKTLRVDISQQGHNQRLSLPQSHQNR